MPRNIGIVTGAVSNLIVIDCDNSEAMAWADVHLPATPWRVRTARGEHRGYRHPGGLYPNTVRIETGDPEIKIDVRGDGGYVVAPGSQHRDGMMNEWAVGEPSAVDALPVFDPAWLSLGVPSSHPVARVAAEVSAGHRNDTLFREGCRLRRLGWNEAEIGAALQARNLARCRPPLEAREVQAIAASAAGYEPAEDWFPFTEAGDGGVLRRLQCGDRAGRWLVYEDHHWVEQATGEVHRLALGTVRARQAAAIRDTGDAREKRIRWTVGGEARRRLENLLALAEKVHPVADAGDQWDVLSELLGVPNGVELRTGLLRPGRPEDRITRVSPVSYDPVADATRWRKFVLDVCDGDVELADYFQVMCGTCSRAKPRSSASGSSTARARTGRAPSLRC